jgi:FkbM family methyltransferase
MRDVLGSKSKVSRQLYEQVLLNADEVYGAEYVPMLVLKNGVILTRDGGFNEVDSLVYLKSRGWKITVWSENILLDGRNVMFEARGDGSGDVWGVRSIIEDGEYRDLLPVRGKNVLDIGACSGDSTVWFAIQGAKKVLAVEADKESAWLAQRNVGHNRLKSVYVLHRAVAKEGNSKVGLQRGSNPGMYKTVPGAEVETISLNELLDFFDGEPVVLKMDVEGAEAAVVEGLDIAHAGQIERGIMEEHADMHSRLRKLGLGGLFKFGVAPEAINTVSSLG